NTYCHRRTASGSVRLLGAWRGRRRMRVSQRYKLGRTQGELDFVDVDTTKDTALFIDPRAMAQLNNSWARSCTSNVQSFFQRVLEAIHTGNDDEAIALLMGLGEPNETHLGLSRGRSRGNAVGEKLAKEFWQALSSSRAVRSGLIHGKHSRGQWD